jgi:hypothetical protein
MTDLINSNLLLACLVDKDISDLSRILEMLIATTPTGEARNKLTDVNIQLMTLQNTFEEYRKIAK